MPDALPEADPREQIFRLEREIERLIESVEWCRKIAFAARAAIGAGVVLLAAILTLGGIVLAGSNGTTARQTAEKLAQAEQQRAELIGAIELTLVPEPSRLLH